MKVGDVLEKLSAPFPPHQTHWRIGSTWQRDGKKHGMLLAYIDARDVMDRLDAVVGPDGWQDTYEETASGIIVCALSLRMPQEDGPDVWVLKSDGAGQTDVEGQKGGISDAFKRAAVKFGVGRYLYSLDSPKIELDEWNGRPQIPRTFDGAQYLPHVEATETSGTHGVGWGDTVEHVDAVRDNWNDVVAIKAYLENGSPEKAFEVWTKLDNDTKASLWKKWGVFTADEMKAIKGAKND